MGIEADRPMTQLKIHQILIYGAPSLVQAAILVVFSAYLPKFYMDVVGVPAAVLGGIILVSRVWDALIDPAMGRISDGSISRWGRRRPWMLASIAPLVAIFVLIMIPPAGLSAFGSVAWTAILLFAFFIFWTMWSVPYESLGAELSLDYNERTRLLGTREGLFVLGTIAAAVLPIALGAITSDERERFQWVGWLYGAMALITFTACAVFCRERHWRAEQIPQGGLFRTYREVWRNRPFRILVVSYMIGAMATALPATLFFFYVEYVLGSSRADVALALYFTVGFMFLPFWIKLAEWWDKKSAWILAMAVNTAALCGIAFLGSGDFGAYLVFVAVSGVGFGGTLALPASMQADVIDYDESKTGERREGMYVGFWSIARKMAGGVGAGVALVVLSWAGYEPNAAQPASSVWALRILYAVIPVLLNIVAIAVAWRYPIDRKFHRRLRSQFSSQQLEGALLNAHHACEVKAG